MSSFQEIQKDLEEKNIEPENFQDRIIFMSMFNDIILKTDDENCVSNAEKVKKYAKKSYQDMAHFCVRGRKRDGKAILTIKRTVRTHSRQNGKGIQGMLSSCVQKYQCIESWDLEAEER